MALPSRRGLPVDLLIQVESLVVLGMDLTMNPDTTVLPVLRSHGLLRDEPVHATGGRLYRLMIPDDMVVSIQIGALGAVSLGARGDQLRLGVPVVALPFLGRLKPYTIDAENLPGGGKLLTLDLPRNEVARFAIYKVDIAVRIPKEV